METENLRIKRENPRENANALSAMTLFYTIPTMIEGWKNELKIYDLYETFSEHKSHTLGNKLETAWLKEVKNAEKRNGLPSLRTILMKTFGLELAIYGLLLLVIELCFKIPQCILLGELVAFYLNDYRHYSQTDLYLYAVAIVGCSLMTVLTTHPTGLGILHVGMKMRVACCSLIYRKALKLSKSTMRQTTVGQTVNLLSNDVNRFDSALQFIHILWIGPLETVIITYFMYEEVGVSAVVGVVVLLLFIPLQLFLGKKSATFRLRTALRTDERVRLMNEIISGIQVIKMYTWEKPFAKVIAFARRHEIKSIRLTSYIRACLVSFQIFIYRLSLFLTILLCVLWGFEIDAKKVFVVTGFYNVLRLSMTAFLPLGIAQMAELNVSIKRLNRFLLYDEIHLSKHHKNSHGTTYGSMNKVDFTNMYTKGVREEAIYMQNGTANWSESSSANTFTNLNLQIKQGSLVAIVGPVGSGKTSLLHAILNELPLIHGTLEINGSVSYASQEPWIFPTNVRQNILFGQPWEKVRYNAVVRNCSLERDFKLFRYEDRTIVGERGVSLSGGQRARINLARAVYKKADIYLLDDPLSAVDAHVGKELFEKCIKSYLRKKTVILITHQLQYLKDVDHIIILENGMIKAEGSFQKLQGCGLDLGKLLNLDSTKDVVDKDDTDPDLSRRASVQRQNSAVSSLEEEHVLTEPQQIEEQRTSGSVSGYVYSSYFKAGSNMFCFIILVLLFLFTQFTASFADYFLAYWVNLEQIRTESDSNNINLMQSNDSNYIVYVSDNLIPFQHQPNVSATSKLKVLESGVTFDNNSTTDLLTTEDCSYIYTAVTIAVIVFALTRSFAFFIMCMNASVRLHDKMFESIIHATMEFFNTNTSGRILNRFSKDVGCIDELLPMAMIDAVQIGLGVVGIIIVVGTVNYWLMIPTVVITLMFFALRKFYVTSSRSIKRLEGITRSPVFAYMNTSLQGITTIRAFGAESILEKEFDNHQDLHSSAWYLFISTSKALGYWVDCVSVIYIATVTVFSVVSESFGGSLGLALTQAIGLTGTFQWCMRQSTEMENQMTSVERVLEYNKVDHERDFESAPDKKPPQSWPNKGEIRFINLFLRYLPEDPPVLKNLNFSINSVEKIGIVGRTGAGKSSLIAALFQLAPTNGSIVIDGIDIETLGLHDLRSKISIIPQEPVLFSGTLRKNLDPFDEYTNDVLLKALEEVELKEVVSDLVDGLNTAISENGSNFSVGQRQLLCLARAIIRNNKILVLDEATANVDAHTDSLIQHTIRKKFCNCTVLTIAHRLHTIMDSDRVMVMDAGRMVEFDHPHLLLQNKNGAFSGLIQQTGSAMSDTLTTIATEFITAAKKLDVMKVGNSKLIIYTIPVMIEGWKMELKISDLHETFSEHRSHTLGNKLETAWLKEVKNAEKRNSLPSLRTVLIKTFGLEFAFYGLLLLVIELCFKIPQCILLGGLVAFYMDDYEHHSQIDFYLYAVGIVACSLMAVLITHPTVLGILHMGMKIRVACCSLIYRKALKLSKSTMRQTTVGQTLNLLSNDVNLFDSALQFIHVLWIGPLETIIVTYFMYEEVGISAVVGVVVLLLFIPLQLFLRKKSATLRLQTALRTDERIRLMNEIISGIRVIKMYTWEKQFAKVISFVRRHEIKSIRLSSYIRACLISFPVFVYRLSLFLTILMYVLWNSKIDAKKVFIVTAFYNVLRITMTGSLPVGISQMAELNVSIERLNKFLLRDETQLSTHRRKNQRKTYGSMNKSDFAHIYNNGSREEAIYMQNGTAKWSESSSTNTFTNLNLQIKQGSLVAIVGPVGSGKTSLLHAILNELPLLHGTLEINGSVSYASQEPWIFPTNVRQNILFGKPWEKVRYNAVVRNCSLERDFKLFRYEDRTIVGERGVSFSGGQRARINLARAVYKKADIYLLDDPLSAVDAHVGKELFEKCIKSYLRKKTVILITHQLQYLKDVDHIIILENGMIKAEGSFQKLQGCGLDFGKLLNLDSTKDVVDKDDTDPDLSRRASVQRQNSAVSSLEEEHVLTEPQQVEEQRTSGSVSGYVYLNYFKSGANMFCLIILVLLFLFTQFTTSFADYFLAYWVNLEQIRTGSNFNNINLTQPNDSNYTLYVSDNLTPLLHHLNTSATSKLKVLNNGVSLTNNNTTVLLTTEDCSYIYTAVTIAIIVFALTRSFAFYIMCMNASIRLHDKMFDSIIHATMEFFYTNTPGRILNRFSKDIGCIDELLPKAIIEALQIGLLVVAVLIVVGTVNYWLVIPTFVITVMFFGLRKFYVTSSRSIKRLEGITRSPVFAYMNTSLQGITTIRAFGAESILEKEFDNHQDLHSSAWYLFISTSRAFGYWVDCISVIYIATVTAVSIASGNFGGSLGLALTQAISLTGTLQWCMRQSAEMENQMTSVERVLEYNKVEHERDFESVPDKNPPQSWPNKGEIRFINLFLRHLSHDPPVLKNLNFAIHSLEKIGIVGRTGAGKSSIIAALFQLAPTNGWIAIDGFDVETLGLHDLRSKISIIPQEPVIFSGTLRKNLDPFDEHTNDVLWKALEEVELKEAVSHLVDGLNTVMSENGSNFSVGQKQLLCLARAIIRNNKILVLDEATANVDAHTDAVIQHTIRKKFRNCTVLTIAHRLHTIMDSDRVMVMDAGRIVEFDHPHLLLQNRNGVFSSLVQQTGSAMSDTLKTIATEVRL
ncbi:hypothetical protein FQR65_LT13746 [Abscondita terminalis]|nr:hypothetical protein FQR65_LT13746 [Abscondita terminalis]